jgi:uroporphyrinogen III methyltransferase / synthase
LTLPGTVFLVGAGPGDPGLITVLGLECLRAADVVVFDRLVHPALLKHAPNAALINVGKQPDHHLVPQTQINQTLIEHARAGKVVCRLKGGDPFVFGRGGEEAEALAHAGIPFEVVPGVTSALAAPAYAGIPVTHRDLACSFTVITGHRKGEIDASCDWERAAGADTLVFLMGVTALSEITAKLLEYGRSAATPAAVIERGTWSRQRTVAGTLADIVVLTAQAGIRPPAALVVGQVVGLRERLRWFDTPERRPLLGRRVLNTRPAEDAAGFSLALRLAGAEPVELPATEIVPPSDIAPLDTAIRRLAQALRSAAAYDWIAFTSAHAVTAFCTRVLALGYDSRILAGAGLACVGPATAARLRDFGLVADLVPDRSAGRHLAAVLGDVAGQRILLPRSAVALRDLPEGLIARGARVTEVISYETRPAPPDETTLAALLNGEIDCATFFSPSAVCAVAAMVEPRRLGEVLQSAMVLCIGETTAEALQELGLAPSVAADASVAGMMAALRATVGPG